MSTETGVRAGFAKCLIFFMAGVILVQGVAYLGLAIWGFTFRGCLTNPLNVSTQALPFAMDLIYFADEDCGKYQLEVPIQPLDTSTTKTINITLNGDASHAITNRTFIFLIVYSAVSGLWILTSLMVLAAICGRISRLSSNLCFWPWFLVVIAGSILDAVATGFHINDIIHTTSVNDAFAYVGATSDDMQTLAQFDMIFTSPPIIMTCLSSRVVIVWLVNIFGTSFCLSLAQVLSRVHKPQKQDKTPVAPLTQSETPTVSMPRQMQSPPPTIEITESYPTQIMPRPLPIQASPGAAPPMNRRFDEAPQSPLSVYLQTSTGPSPSGSANNLRRSDSGDANSYRDIQRQLSSSPMPPEELAVQSPLNIRYTADPAQQRVSTELRSQMPWSYTSVQPKPPPVPRKPQKEIYPQIPEADYAQTIPKGQRPNNVSTTQEAYSRW